MVLFSRKNCFLPFAKIAGSVDLDRYASRRKSVGKGRGSNRGFHRGILQLRDAAASAANQELGGVVVGFLVVAADEGVEALHSVDQALGEQEIEGTVDGGGLAAAGEGAKAVQQGVGADGLVGLEDEAQNVAPDGGEADAAAGAAGLGAREAGGKGRGRLGLGCVRDHPA